MRLRVATRSCALLRLVCVRSADVSGNSGLGKEERYQVALLLKGCGFKEQFYGDRQSICGSTWRRAIPPGVSGTQPGGAQPPPSEIKMTGVDAALRFKHNLLGKLGGGSRAAGAGASA